MTKQAPLFLALLCALLSTAIFAADEPPNIETLMTAEELRATGVDDLSRTEIRALNAWLERFRDGEITAAVEQAVAEAPVSTNTDAPAVRQEPADVYPPPRERLEINTRISGEFSGWEGRTQFTMDNGQVWEQRRGRRWKITLQNPEVRLYQNFLGAWEMEVVSEDRSIGVRRIR